MTFIRITLAALAIALLIPAPQAQAQNCTTSEIRIFATGFCPRGFAPLQGKMMQISQYQALYSLLGVQYGGDGHTSFALPDMRGRAIVGAGSTPAMGNFKPGQTGGQEYQALTEANLPLHDHDIDVTVNGRLRAHDGPGDTNNPNGAYLAGSGSTKVYIKNIGSGVAMARDSVQGRAKGQTDKTGQGQVFSVRDPYIVLTPCICLNGTFPSRPQ